MTNRDRLKQFFDEEFDIKLKNENDIDISCGDVDCKYKSCDKYCPLYGDGFDDFLDKDYKPNIKKKENSTSPVHYDWNYPSPEPILNRLIPQTPPTIWYNSNPASLTESTIKEKPKEDETVVFSMHEISW